MSNRAKVILSCLPCLVIGLVAISLPKIREWRAAKVLEELETTPLKSVVTTAGNEVSSTRHTFSIGSFAVTDVGNLRLAFEDLSFSGQSSGGVTLATDSTFSGAGGHTGVGNRRFENKRIPGGTQCTFGGTTFEFVEAKLKFGKETIDANGQPTLVVVGADRGIREVKQIKQQDN